MTVVEIVVTLVLDGVPPQSIGIMSPYRAQVVLIRNLLRQQQLSTINVGVIEDYQAVELEVIILSLVRSEENFIDHDVKGRVGVFRQRQRTNVALTRAVSLLIVVGNPNIMSRDPIWRQWLWFCLRNGFWYGERSWNIAFDLIPDYSMKRDTSMDLDLNASKKKEFSGIWGVETETSSTSKGANNIVNIGTLERIYNEREA